MQVSILGPRQIIWQGRVKKLLLPAEEGEMCVLDFHQPFLVRLSKGQIQLGIEGRAAVSENKILVKDGIAHMRGNELTILIEA